MPGKPFSLGIDIGTGSTKAGLVSADGHLLAVGRASHAIEEPRPGWSETDPIDWMVSVQAAVSQVLAANPGVEVATVGLSGQMHGVVLCDPSGSPLRPAVLWSDRRSEPLLGTLLARLDLAFDGATRTRLANPVVAGMAGPSVAALLADEPELSGRIALLLQPKDWVRRQLTGETATDPSDASATLLWDAAEDGWSPEACHGFGVDPAWLAPITRSDSAGGTLQAGPAKTLGLPTGITVAVGAADTAAALLGAGLAVGETQVTTGTGGQIARLIGPGDLNRPEADQTGRTHLFRAASFRTQTGVETTGQEANWYAMAAMQNVGIAINWLTSLLEASDDEVAAAMAGHRDGSSRNVRFEPYLTGERTPHMDPSLTGRWTGLRPSTSRAELIRSVFDGVARAMADGLTALVDAGHNIDEAVLAGGGSVAPWWRQMLADALEIPLTPHDAADASVRGAAVLGWAAIGHRIDPGSAVTRAEPVHPGR